MKELYQMALEIHVKGISKDLKELTKRTTYLLNYLREGLSPEDLEEIRQEYLADNFDSEN